MTGQEISGYIDVKVPSKGRKFGQWKAWKKQWCVIRHNDKSTIHIQLSNTRGNVTNCLEVPHNAVLCRSESRSKRFAFGIFCSSSVTCRQAVVFLAGNTETETQVWMQRIRTFVSPYTVSDNEFYISLIDNCHSRTAGLAGLYGTLSTSLTGISISDPSAGQIKVHWKWTQIDHISAQASNNTVDDNRICIIHTSREFSCGEGELQLFCSSASGLESCLTQNHSKHHSRIISSPLPAPPSFHYRTLPLISGRRLSRSEGDLRCWPSESPLSVFHLRSYSTSRTSTNSEDEMGSPKIAPSLISAGLGLMLSTPGCSEPDNLHEYQPLDTAWQDVFLSDIDYQCLESDIDELPDLNIDYKKSKYNTTRRESGVSIASGIYEEIQEQPTEYYENLYSLEPGSLTAPPPLPPRQLDCVHNSSEVSSTLQSSEEYNKQDSDCDKTKPNGDDKTAEEPDYLPMSPGGPYSSTQATYVTMANLINNAHISEPVT